MSSLSKNRNRANAGLRGSYNGLLLSIALLHAPALAQAQNRLVHLINAYRESPDACEESVPQAAGPLSPEPKLATVNLSQHGEQALRDAGLHIAAMEAISVSGPSTAAAAMQAIRSRYCKVLAKPEYTLIAISRMGNTWRVVLSNHAKLTVKSVPNALKMELTSLRSSSPFKLQNLRQKYLACFHRISIRLSSGLYGGR